jgi:hypothetical protein
MEKIEEKIPNSKELFSEKKTSKNTENHVILCQTFYLGKESPDLNGSFPWALSYRGIVIWRKSFLLILLYKFSL